MKILAYFLSLIILLNIAYCGTIDPNTPDSKYIEYGKNFKYVAKLNCHSGKDLYSGSAVVIDPHWILTAAHVVEHCTSWTAIVEGENYALSKIVMHPDYKANIFGSHDIALGYSEKPIILDFYPKIYESEDEVGKICAISGWGLTGTFHTGSSKNDGLRRAGSNHIDRIEKHVLICSPSKKGQLTTELEYLICGGDSGGPLFLDNKVAGINSSVVGYDGKSDSTFGDESCHTRVSVYKVWILDTMKDKHETEKN